MKEPLIVVRNLEKKYTMGEVQVNALRGVSLEIQQGEFVAIMGASGSGKSTFMNILGCLDKATQGEYFMEGRDVQKLNKNEQAELRNNKMGFIFQSFNILPRTSAQENVELPLLYNNKIGSKERRERARKALDAVGLSNYYHHMPNQLSGGQQQRVAIARALVNKPVLVLADEPTGNLDTRTSYEILDIFQKLNDTGITIVMVTHENDIAMCAKSNIVFRDGKIISNNPVTNRKIASEELDKLPVEMPVGE